jgi:hypothetical protein
MSLDSLAIVASYAVEFGQLSQAPVHWLEEQTLMARDSSATRSERPALNRP